VRAKITEPDNVLVNIGSDVVVRRTNADAIGFIEDRIRELEALERKIAESLEQVRAQVNEIARRIDQTYQKSRA
jgi:prefoldin alpha subunit